MTALSYELDFSTGVSISLSLIYNITDEAPSPPSTCIASINVFFLIMSIIN